MYGEGYDGGALAMMAQAAEEVATDGGDATQATLEPTRERPVARRVTRGGGRDDQGEPVAAASLGADAEPPAGQVEQQDAAPAPTEPVAGGGKTRQAKTAAPLQVFLEFVFGVQKPTCVAVAKTVSHSTGPAQTWH